MTRMCPLLRAVLLNEAILEVAALARLAGDDHEYGMVANALLGQLVYMDGEGIADVLLLLTVPVTEMPPWMN